MKMFSKPEVVVIEGYLWQLQEKIGELVTSKGFRDEPRSFGELIALAHSELSEALDAYRESGDVAHTWRGYKIDGNGKPTHLGKPEGVASELADAIIRILDMSDELGIPTIPELFAKLEYNATRLHRHGGKAL